MKGNCTLSSIYINLIGPLSSTHMFRNTLDIFIEGPSGNSYCLFLKICHDSINAQCNSPSVEIIITTFNLKLIHVL